MSKLNYLQMKKRSLTVSNWILATLIGSLGFSSCKKPADSDDDMRLMYGVPYASYSIKGKVVDNFQNPVPGIKVEIQGLKNQQYPILEPSVVMTDAKGEFSKDYRQSVNEFEFNLKYSDVDGEVNGSFKTAEQKVGVKTSDITGKPDGWFVGSVKKETTIILEKEVK